MIVNGISIDMALTGCSLQTTVPASTIYSRVKTRREKGTYNALILKRVEEARQVGLIIDITKDDDDSSMNVLPVTMNTNEASCFGSTATSSQRLSASQASELTRKKSRRSPKQASIAQLDAKRLKVEYDGRFKAAFKDATNLIARKTGEPVQSMCLRLNKEFNLDGKRQLTRSTVYQAAKDGLAGTSPKKKGPAPKIPEKLMKVLATHAEVCQVGDGELKGRDVKRLIGALIVETPHEEAFQVESVWRKVRSEYPAALQAANKLSVEDARAQWTTYDNLNQWSDDVKEDLIETGLVEDKVVLDKDGKLVSEVCFKGESEQRIINMDETHHNLAITGDRGGSRAVSYHIPAFHRGASRGVKSGRHVTGVYATNAAGEALPPFYIFDSTAKPEENFRFKMNWLVGLPSITGRFGCPTQVESDSFFAVRSRGSMDEELLNQYIEEVIVPLYPNMNKTAIFDARTGRLNQGPVILKLDAGPGRIVSSEIVLAKREALFERGLIIILGLPNATSVQQEMDALYGPFKSATYS